MNHEEFKDAFHGLSAIYGEKAYPMAIKSKLFSMLGRLDKSDFMRVVDNLILEHNKAPAAGMILKACLPFLRTTDARIQMVAIRELEAREGKCSRCENAGVVFRYPKSNPALEYAFRCMSCGSAAIRKIGPAFPAWRPEYSETYLTLKEKWDQEAAPQPVLDPDDARLQFPMAKKRAEMQAQILALLRTMPRSDRFEEDW